MALLPWGSPQLGWNWVRDRHGCLCGEAEGHAVWARGSAPAFLADAPRSLGQVVSPTQTSASLAGGTQAIEKILPSK